MFAHKKRKMDCRILCDDQRFSFVMAIAGSTFSEPDTVRRLSIVIHLTGVNK